MPFKSISDYKSNARFLHFKNTKVAYWANEWLEERPLITLLHGFPSASWDWHHQWEFLSRDYNLLALDFVGFGISDKPIKHKYSIQEQADLVEKLWHLLRVGKSSIIAHDYGVSVAQTLLYRASMSDQGRVDKICFLNGGLFAEAHRPLLIQKLLASHLGPFISLFMQKRQLEQSLLSIFSQNTPPSSSDIESLWTLLRHNRGTRVVPQVLYYLRERKVYRDQWVEAMQKKQDKLGFINGILDPISGFHMLERFRHLCPDSPTLAIDVGHYPQLEAPEKVSNALRSFFDSDACRFD